MKEGQAMSIKKAMLLMGLCVLFAGCSTERFYGQSGSATNTDIGVRYLLGRGVQQNDTKAFYYFREAADDGDPFAQNELGYMYAAGKGTPRNYGKAFIYYQKAANHDLASAQYNLGMLYKYGLGVAPNQALSLEWTRKAAAHGFEPAKQALART
jgi:hypothetical protein